MSNSLTVAVAQLNPIMGDMSANVAKLITAWEEAREQDADLLLTSELYITGYPTEDFVLKPRHHKIIRESIDHLAQQTASGPAILLGTPWLEEGNLYNAILLLDGGQIVEKRFKCELPNYGPFDEKRLFTPAPLPRLIEWRGFRLGVMTCEDMWFKAVPSHLAAQGVELFLVANGSPYALNKQPIRYEKALNRIEETGVPVIYCNQVGGQDQLLFDGASFAFNQAGELMSLASSWEEVVRYITCEHDESGALILKQGKVSGEREELEELYLGLMTGIRDFVRKNKFENVILGLSGGIDSALVALLAVDALGASHVKALMMPSPYTSADSREDASKLAKTLGIRLDTVPIAGIMKAFDAALVEQFMGLEPDVTEENIQARIRGIILMAVSNKSGAMLLATGNKSEMAVGYTTLYGDMCGGYAPLKDVYKTKVYDLVEWRNANKPMVAKGPDGSPIPARILSKAPTAELRANQRDQDSLPPYEVLDKILKHMLEGNLGVAETISMGQHSDTVRRVCMMLDRAEHKRKQAPPGPRVTNCHFGLDRRYPITNRYADRWQTVTTD
ncbi:MAG: NAD+ synthase [Bdellovibrionales bacterium]